MEELSRDIVTFLLICVLPLVLLFSAVSRKKSGKGVETGTIMQSEKG
jgi:hypothetical protein